MTRAKEDLVWFAKAREEQRRRQEGQRRIQAKRQAAIETAHRPQQNALSPGNSGLGLCRP